MCYQSCAEFLFVLTVAHDNFMNQYFIPEQEVIQAQHRCTQVSSAQQSLRAVENGPTDTTEPE